MKNKKILLLLLPLLASCGLQTTKNPKDNRQTIPEAYYNAYSTLSSVDSPKSIRRANQEETTDFSQLRSTYTYIYSCIKHTLIKTFQ